MARSATLTAGAEPTPLRTAYRPADEARSVAAFLHGATPSSTPHVSSELRDAEYGRLDAQGQVYLDYTGGGLFAESQLSDHLDLLRRTVLGNPHSVNPTSAAAGELLERARKAVLRYFNAPAEYRVIFTPNATGALKLVGEAYPFDAHSRLLLTSDNHNSVNGLREFARASGAATTYVPSTAPSLRVDEGDLKAHLRVADEAAEQSVRLPGAVELLRRPAPARVDRDGAGRRLGRARGLRGLRAVEPARPRRVAAGLRPDLALQAARLPDRRGLPARSRARPRAAPSPLVRRRHHRNRQRQGDWHVPADGEAAFEDGTVNYLALPAVELGLRYLEGIGIETVHSRVRCLTAWLLDELAALRHANGSPVVQIYGPRTTDRRGGTIAFNFLRPDGRPVDIGIVDERAADVGISLRTGCFCNPGAAEHAFRIPRQALLRRAESPAADHIRELGVESGGAVRVSLGLATTFRDVYRFMRFASSFCDE